MKICLIHDYLNQFGGAERVLSVFHQIWPEAPIFTALVDKQVLKNLGIDPSCVKTLPALNRKVFHRFYKGFSFLYPLFFEFLDLNDFDVIISSSANFAKGVVCGSHQIHINYCHTPPRFLYHLPTESGWRKGSLGRLLLSPIDNFLRVWDFQVAQRVDFFIANSQIVAERIAKFYRRESVVIHPPVSIPDLSEEDLLNTSRDYYLTVSRLTSYKHIDLIIRSFALMKKPLIIVGSGPEFSKLENLAKNLGADVTFKGFVSDQELRSLYLKCKATVFASEKEDFGLVPVESMAFGRPVIAYRSGGVCETVIENKTGVFFDHLQEDSLVKAVSKLEGNSYWFSAESVSECRKRSFLFSEKTFSEKIYRFVLNSAKS